MIFWLILSTKTISPLTAVNLFRKVCCNFKTLLKDLERRYPTLYYAVKTDILPVLQTTWHTITELSKLVRGVLQAAITKLWLNLAHVWEQAKRAYGRQAAKSRNYNARTNNTPWALATLSVTVTSAILVKKNYGAITFLFQLTVMLVVLGLYQIFIFFKKMYETSKWTTEAARFSKILVQVFWLLEIGTYSVFTYLMSIRPELNVYGFGNAAALAVSRLEALELAQGMGTCVIVFTPLIVIKYKKKQAYVELVLVLLGLSVYTTGQIFQTELLDLQLAYGWLDESKLLVAISATEDRSIAPERLNRGPGETPTYLEAALQIAETLNEQKTKVFYSLILTSLKALHSGFVCTLLIIASIQYVRTNDLSYHLLSILTLNALFMCVFGLLSRLPSILEELTVFSSASSSMYDGTTQIFTAGNIAQAAYNA